jgi:ectoine hydroxylase
LKYEVRRETVTAMARKAGLVAPKGAAGDVLLFHPSVIHGSNSNISPFSRRAIILTYNAVSNAPPEAQIWRPDFLVSRNSSPIENTIDELI